MTSEDKRPDGGKIVGERTVGEKVFTVVEIEQEPVNDVRGRDGVREEQPRVRPHGHLINPNNESYGRTTGARPTTGIDLSPPKQR